MENLCHFLRSMELKTIPITESPTITPNKDQPRAPSIRHKEIGM